MRICKQPSVCLSKWRYSYLTFTCVFWSILDQYFVCSAEIEVEMFYLGFDQNLDFWLEQQDWLNACSGCSSAYTAFAFAKREPSSTHTYPAHHSRPSSPSRTSDTYLTINFGDGEEFRRDSREDAEDGWWISRVWGSDWGVPWCGGRIEGEGWEVGEDERVMRSGSSQAEQSEMEGLRGRGTEGKGKVNHNG